MKEILTERLSTHVDRSAGPDACHPWTRACDRDGYGVTSVRDPHKRQIRVNRAAFFVEHGYWPELARHTCDNRVCANPKHIVDGTVKDNSQDMVERGRSLRGARNCKNVIAEDQIPLIRESPETCKALADRYGVQPAAIWKIKTRRTWKHV